MPRIIHIDKTVIDQINTGNLRMGEAIDLLRWVRPEFVRVIKDPVD